MSGALDGHRSDSTSAEHVHAHRTQLLAEAIRRRDPSPGPEFPCPYLPDRLARNLTLALDGSAPGVYHSLMDLGFRRMGSVFYRPTCAACRECRMIRVPVAAFQASRAQRRCLRRNADIAVEVSSPQATAEKHQLYARYLAARHDGAMEGSLDEFSEFLYGSCVESLEFTYRLNGRVVGVGIADLEPLAMSAVYCYFEPSQASRSLGVFNVLTLIQECRRREVPHLYLGYYVRDSRSMSYKALYQPFELLADDGTWRRCAVGDRRDPLS